MDVSGLTPETPSAAGAGAPGGQTSRGPDATRSRRARRLAFVSDIHGNLPALEATLADIAERDVDAVYHLGDLVGYGPWPNEVVELIERTGIAGIAGNYDTTVALGHPSCGCQHDDPRQKVLAADSYRWTRAAVADTTRRYLANLPFRLDLRPLGGHRAGPAVILVHGAATLNTVYWREARDDRFCRKMMTRLGARPGDAVLFGHTHKPWTRVVDGCTLINTGSAGRPKDGDPRGSYALLEIDGAGIDVAFPRVPYDLGLAARAIAEAGLPPELGTILRTGGSLSAPADHPRPADIRNPGGLRAARTKSGTGRSSRR